MTAKMIYVLYLIEANATGVIMTTISGLIPIKVRFLLKT